MFFFACLADWFGFHLDFEGAGGIGVRSLISSSIDELLNFLYLFERLMA